MPGRTVEAVAVGVMARKRGGRVGVGVVGGV